MRHPDCWGHRPAVMGVINITLTPSVMEDGSTGQTSLSAKPRVRFEMVLRCWISVLKAPGQVLMRWVSKKSLRGCFPVLKGFALPIHR